MKRSASTNSAKRCDAKSLSITASTPVKLPFASFTTGIPPPPAATTTCPSFNKVRMVLISLISTGFGEATTLRQPRPASSLKVAPDFSASAFASSSE